MQQIALEERFSCLAGIGSPGIEACHLILDHELQKWFSVRIPSFGLGYGADDEDTAIQILSRCVDCLDDSIQTIEVEQDGSLTFTTEEAVGKFSFPVYGGEPKDVVSESALDLVDRLDWSVNLVRLKGRQDSEAESKQLFVYKRTLIPQRIQRCANEIQILKGVSGREDFIQLHKVVTEGDSLCVVGFTTHYIPGRSLLDYNLSFRFSWLDDITKAIDHLNFVLGVIHNDVAAHNILIDSRTDTPKIIDFDRSFTRSTTGYDVFCEKSGALMKLSEETDTVSVICAIYEALTKDRSHGSHDSSKIEEMPSWAPIMPIEEVEGGIDAYIEHLNKWVHKRRSTRFQNTVNSRPVMLDDSFSPAGIPYWKKPRRSLVEEVRRRDRAQRENMKAMAVKVSQTTQTSGEQLLALTDAALNQVYSLAVMVATVWVADGVLGQQFAEALAEGNFDRALRILKKGAR